MKKTVLRKYAQLIAQTGVNVQPGQEVFIAADLDQPEFVKMLVEECYKRKAKKVVVDWSYQPLQKLHYRYRTMTTLSKLDNYEEARWQHYVDAIPCRIYLLSEDPDGLNGINQEKMAKSQQRQIPGPDREQVSVVHRRRARRGLGQEAVPGPAHQPGYGEAVGGHSVHQPGG